MIRVLLADDHGAVRAGLRMVLAADPGIEVVGEAADGAVAVRQARALRPDVVLMDVQMPGTDGIEATAQIVAEATAAVLVLTTFDIDEYVFGALRAGAAGFLVKSAEPGELVEAVRRVGAGDGVLAPEVTARVLATFVGSPTPGQDRDRDPRLAGLTERERQVLAALGRGHSNADLAAELMITEATAKTHVSRVLAKLGCRSRMQAAIIARENDGAHYDGR